MPKSKNDNIKSDKRKKEQKAKKERDISLFAKIIFLFERFAQYIKNTAPISKMIYKEKVIAQERCGSNEGYADYAVKVKILKKVLSLILIIAIAVGIIFSAGRLDIDDIYYMAMDIGYMNTYSESATDILNYTKAQNNSDFSLYKKGLAVASGTEITLFNATGRVTLSEGDVFANPVIISSNKYALIYDLGGQKLSVYNSFKKLYTFTYDGNIAYASMSENGGFCVAVSSRDYKSVVHTYNEDCEQISTYSSNKYVISSEISENSKYTAVLATSAENGQMRCEVTVLKKNRDKVYSKFDIGYTTPYKCKILDNDRVAIVCSDKVLVYTLKGKLKEEYIYPQNTQLSHISYENDALALLFGEDLISGENRLVVLGKNGKTKYDGIIKGSFTDMQIYEDCIFLLTNNGICKFNYKTKVTTVKEVTDTYGKILVCDKNRVILCTDSQGIYFDI